jgi:hypothetical protein
MFTAFQNRTRSEKDVPDAYGWHKLTITTRITGGSMKSLLSIGLAILSMAVAIPQNAPKACTPTTPKDAQKRTRITYRAASDTSATEKTVADVLNWEFPANLSQKATQTSQKPIDDTERQVFTVTGLPWKHGNNVATQLIDIQGIASAMQLFACISENSTRPRT